MRASPRVRTSSRYEVKPAFFKGKWGEDINGLLQLSSTAELAVSGTGQRSDMAYTVLPLHVAGVRNSPSARVRTSSLSHSLFTFARLQIEFNCLSRFHSSHLTRRHHDTHPFVFGFASRGRSGGHRRPHRAGCRRGSCAAAG